MWYINDYFCYIDVDQSMRGKERKVDCIEYEDNQLVLLHNSPIKHNKDGEGTQLLFEPPPQRFRRLLKKILVIKNIKLYYSVDDGHTYLTSAHF